MARLLMLTVALLLLGCSQAQQQSTNIPEKSFVLADFKAALKAGKPVLLEVGAPW